MLDETQTEGRWISFVEVDPAPKTKRWRVVSRKTLEPLGLVSWFGAWRRYAFSAEEGAVLQQECLHDIADFCSYWTLDHKHHQTREAQKQRAKVS